MCLQCKQLNLAPGGADDVDGIPAFLGKALSPPHPKSISNALELLVELGAMEAETNNLTDLGRCLSVLSLEPRVGKMVSTQVAASFSALYRWCTVVMLRTPLFFSLLVYAIEGYLGSLARLRENGLRNRHCNVLQIPICFATSASAKES